MTREERRKTASGQKKLISERKHISPSSPCSVWQHSFVDFLSCILPVIRGSSLGTCYIPLPELILSGDDLSEGSNNNNLATFAFGEWFYLIEGAHLISETPQMMIIVDQQRFISWTWTWNWELEVLLHLFPRYATVDNWLLLLCKINNWHHPLPTCLFQCLLWLQSPNYIVNIESIRGWRIDILWRIKQVYSVGKSNKFDHLDSSLLSVPAKSNPAAFGHGPGSVCQ